MLELGREVDLALEAVDAHAGGHLTYHLVLSELQKRGEDPRSELPVVLTLLSSGRAEQRYHGWMNLRRFFPDLAAKIPDYNPVRTLEECRAKTDSIRSLVA